MSRYFLIRLRLSSVSRKHCSWFVSHLYIHREHLYAETHTHSLTHQSRTYVYTATRCDAQQYFWILIAKAVCVCICVAYLLACLLVLSCLVSFTALVLFLFLFLFFIVIIIMIIIMIIIAAGMLNEIGVYFIVVVVVATVDFVAASFLSAQLVSPFGLPNFWWICWTQSIGVAPTTTTIFFYIVIQFGMDVKTWTTSCCLLPFVRSF